MQVTVDSLQVNYVDRGTGNSVLLLHGWGVDAQTYHLILDHLSDHFRVIAPDLPGFGLTDAPPTPWGVEDYAAFVLHFLEAVKVDPSVVIGHSNGGRILLYLLSETPPALHAEKAVLLDSAGIRPRHGIIWYIKVYSYKAAKKVLRAKPMARIFPHAVERFQQKLGSDDYRNASEWMRKTLVRLVNSDLTDRLPSVQASTLLIWGEKDDATPLSDAQVMEMLIPDAGLVVLEGAGHFAFAEQWGKCRAVLDSFLNF